MGVDFSKERPPLAVACVAEIMHLDATQFLALRKALQVARSISHRRSLLSLGINPTDDPSATQDEESDAHVHDMRSAWRAKDLTTEAFAAAMESSDIVEHDREVLQHMFGLMDRTGDELIHSLELLIATALLVKGSFATKLDLAMACLIADLNEKPLKTTHLVFLLSTMTTAANYFGDQLLPLPVLEAIADDAFQEMEGAQDVDATTAPAGIQSLLVQSITNHPVVQDYVSLESQTWSPR